MSGASLLYAWEPQPWLFFTILTPDLIVLTLVMPIVLALLEYYIEGNFLKHPSDSIFNYYSAFFFNQSDVPRQPHSKITSFFFAFFILVFMSFYTGILTDEFFVFKKALTSTHGNSSDSSHFLRKSNSF